jgi:hypothetical protein
MNRRTISTDEYQFALSIFEREFPPRDIITITDETGLGDRPYVRPTVDGHIRINIGSLYDKCLDSDTNKALFAHELTHAWQIEHYGLAWYGKEALGNQVIDPILNNDSYNYQCDPSKTLGDYNAEQQGEIVKDYFKKDPCATTIARKTLSSNTWKLLIGSDGTDITVDENGTYYLVNTAGLIYKYGTDDWDQLPGSAGKTIAANAGRVCLVNRPGDMYELISNSWQKLNGSDAVDIAIDSDGTIWMVNTAGKIYSRNGNTWEQMPGSDGRRISAGGGQVWLTNSEGEIYQYNSNAWTQMSGSDAFDIAVSNDGKIFLTNTVGKIYERNSDHWDQLDGSDGRAVSGNNGKLVVINSKGRLYYREYAKRNTRVDIQDIQVDVSRSFNV